MLFGQKIKLLFLPWLTVIFLLPNYCAAQTTDAMETDEQMFRAMVIEVLDEQFEQRENGSQSVRQKLKLEGLEGDWLGQEIIHDGLNLDVLSATRYKPGDKVIVLANVDAAGQKSYYVIEFIRSGALFWLALLFALAVIAIGRLKGLRAIVVLGITFVVILRFIIPLILSGHNPLLIGIIGSALILLAAIYVTEGFNRSSHVAIVSILISLLATGLLATWFVDWTQLTGFESEDVMYLVSSAHGAINVKGLLLAGIIIGALGVLDDVVISQIALVEQLKSTEAKLSRQEIYRKAMKVGVSHLSSMVNTLFLAYAGASLPLLLLFGVNDLAPLGFSQVVSNEMLATEIVRSLVGSLGLVIAVPISTLLAVRFAAGGTIERSQ
ncbi:MAG: YibE/F family protein [Patescibacteria group bacterium]